MMIPSPTRIAAWLLTMAASCASAALAQDITGVLTDSGYTKIKIAIPGAKTILNDPESTEWIAEAVREDLAFSGYFDVVDPTLYDLVPESEGEQVRHTDWISIGADTLLTIDVQAADGRVGAQARLFDNASETRLFARRYGGETNLLLRVAHQISDDIVRHYTGKAGVAMSRIAFVSKHGDGKEIYLMDYDGRRIRRLTTTGTINLTPAWSPDGNELAFVSWRGRQPGVYVMTAEGELGSLRTIGGELSAAPDWSPDGLELAYSSDVDGNTEIYMLERAAARNTRLTRHPAIDTSPAISPNGREIAFTSDRTGAPQVYLMSAEGLNVRRISWSGNYNDSAAWSPAGDRLAFASRIDGRFEIVVLDLSSDELTRLTWGDGNNENPRWSPDGRHLVFASDRAGSYDIYTMRSDGSSVRRLTRGGDCFTPDWSR